MAISDFIKNNNAFLEVNFLENYSSLEVLLFHIGGDLCNKNFGLQQNYSISEVYFREFNIAQQEIVANTHQKQLRFHSQAAGETQQFLMWFFNLFPNVHRKFYCTSYKSHGGRTLVAKLPKYDVIISDSLCNFPFKEKQIFF